MACSNSILTVVCFALTTVVICSSFDINGGGSTNLVPLGTVDGKTFFADDTKRNWTTSKTLCSSMGMQLAAITSKAQWDILMAAKYASTFKNDHWTAARDSHESRQFTWDGLDSQPSEMFVGGNINLIALGTVGGKTFFADVSARLNGFKKFCYDMGMRLATITLNAQWQLLISKYNANTFAGDHWTAARDSHESLQFTWENLDSQPSETFGIWTTEYRIAYQSCACLNAGPDNREMHFDPSFKVLCETIS